MTVAMDAVMLAMPRTASAHKSDSPESG